MKKYLLVLIFFVPFLAQAQRAISSSGGDATGKTGSASFTVGQTFYTFHSSENGSSSPGVQHSYEISELSALSKVSFHLKMAVYPNPTTHSVTLQTEDLEIAGLSYTLFGMNGQILKSGTIKGLQTEISMENLGAAIYLLKIFSYSELIKSFQIIKNN